LLFAARQRRRELEWPQATLCNAGELPSGAAIAGHTSHLGDVAAHRATAARGATLTSAWSCLADACADGEMASH